MRSIDNVGILESTPIFHEFTIFSSEGDQDGWASPVFSTEDLDLDTSSQAQSSDENSSQPLQPSGASEMRSIVNLRPQQKDSSDKAATASVGWKMPRKAARSAGYR